jgi:hypothetical protein
LSLQNVRWPFVAVSLIISLGLLFGGNWAVRSRTVDEPLKALYGSSPSVESFTIAAGQSGRAITLKMKRVPDLAVEYRRLNEETALLAGAQGYTLRVADSRTPALEAALRRINLFVQEALVTGTFAAMADRVEQEAARHGVSARISVDGGFVYLQMEQGESVLYEVYQRQPQRRAAPEGSGIW